MIDKEVIKTAIESIRRANSGDELAKLKVKYLGRKGVLTEKLKTIGQLPLEERAKQGELLNKARADIVIALANGERILVEVKAKKNASKLIDMTAPVAVSYGHEHPVLVLIDDMVRVFWQMGYEVIEGNEVETPWYNFEALNIPADHPARDVQDTFYLEDGSSAGGLPRTHTSNMQIRYMEQNKPPIRIISPGKVYRNEDEDARHVWMFHQIEGLVVDKGISMADLKGTLLAMMRGVLGPETEIRLRPNYFPYTEPSVEMDATCVICGGVGDCATCGGTGWLELGGAGMVHPQVLRNVGIDPEIYTGFAFGFGPERIAAIKYGVPDIREFWRPNLRFLEQF